MTVPPLKILRPGLFINAHDERVQIDRSEMQRIADAYNGGGKQNRPATLRIGYDDGGDARLLDGVVRYLEERDGYLLAFCESATLAAELGSGAYVRHAAQFFEPHDPKNPMRWTWHLKSVSFMPPPRQLEFGESSVKYMESLNGWGRPVDQLWRSNGFVEFSSRPTEPSDIALLARAYMDAESRLGRFCSIAQAVQALCG